MYISICFGLSTVHISFDSLHWTVLVYRDAGFLMLTDVLF